MDIQDSLNGINGQGGSHVGNGAAPVNGEANSGELVGAIAVARTGLIENLQSAKSHLGVLESHQHEILDRLVTASEGWDQKIGRQFGGLAEQIQALQQQSQGLQQKAQGLQQETQGLQLQFNSFHQQVSGQRQQVPELQQQLQALQEEIRSVQTAVCDLPGQITKIGDQCSGHDQRFTEMAATLEAENRRRSNIEVSLVGIDQKLDKLGKAEIFNLKDEVDRLRSALKTGRDRQMFALAVSLVAFLFASYVFMGKPGWQIVTAYITPLLPPWAI